MSKTKITELQSLIAKLQADRESHLDAIAEIDAAFDKLGLTAAGPKKRRGRPGRPKGSGKKVGKKKTVKGAKRRKFATTATELVLATVKKAGTNGATGAEVSKAWNAAKRPGDAYNTLSLLVKAKKLKRNEVKGERGSRYVAA